MTIAIIAIATISPIRLRGIDFVILRWHSCGCMIKRIKFLGIPVGDQDRALRFYTEKFGMRILTDQEFSEKQRRIELSIPGAETGIVLFTPEGHEDRIGTFVNTSWEVDNIEKMYDDLLGKGVEFAGHPQKQPWGPSLS
jgi:catechol 2,3-dioxygenase-like lactoylglutathione lyase family enzyme